MEILAYPLVQVLDVTGPLAVFANRHDQVAWPAVLLLMRFELWRKNAIHVRPRRLDWTHGGSLPAVDSEVIR